MWDFDTPFVSDETESCSSKTPYTLVELKMMSALAAIKNKPCWYQKIKSSEIAAKWAAELTETGMPQTQVCAVLDELLYDANRSNSRCHVGPIDGTWASDSLLSYTELFVLTEQVHRLETSLGSRDLHPGSNETYDLIHPSLYPI